MSTLPSLRRILAILVLSGLGSAAVAQDAARVRDAVTAYTRANDTRILKDLAEFLAIPNLASDSVNIRRNAQHLVQLLERRGIRAQLLEAPGSPPAVFGELKTPGATRTVVFYAHYDGQPVDTALWANPPWLPTLRTRALNDGGTVMPLPTQPGSVQGEWRMYARSASDDKSPIIAFLAALDALRAGDIRPSVNLKFFFEGEEEAGSDHARDMLTRHRELLGADLWIFGDGPVHQSRRQQVSFGVRGVMGVELTLYGPARVLHSGHYGNWAPNPLVGMAHLIAGVRNGDGRILIEGFYDDVVPPSEPEREAIAAAPSADSALRAELLLAGTEAGNAPLMERIMLPALNVRGVSGGGVGSLATNAVPSVALASMDFRLVPNQTPAHVRSQVEAHFERQGYFVLDRDPTREERLRHANVLKVMWEEGYPASRADMALPVSRAVVRATEMGAGQRVIVVPTSGGSLPLYHFAEVLRTPLITVPMVNHDNNQHAANENLRLQNLFDGIQVYAGVIAHLGRVWGEIP